MPPEWKRMEFITFGCKVNQYETQLLKENIPFFVRDSNICIINTCCVTGRVEKDIRRVIRKKLSEGKDVWITGCFVNKEKENIKLYFPEVKIFNKFDFFKKTKKITSFDSHTRAFVKIEDGCENKCSYCIIPLVRGKVVSRNEEEILEEIKLLVENGYKEVVLTGVDLGAYGKDTGKKLTVLIEKISKIDGLKRLRVSSIEVFYINKEIVDCLSSTGIFCPHFHIPLQSGSDKVLENMKRRYNYSQYFKKIEIIKKKIPDATFTTDVMVGFPGEEDIDFEQTVKAVEEIGFLKVHIFPFSLREGTSAFLMKDKVDGKIKKEREKVLSEICRRVREDILKEFTGKELSVLFERKENYFWYGYSENYIPVFIKSEKDIKNEILPVLAKNIKDDKIYGERKGI